MKRLIGMSMVSVLLFGIHYSSLFATDMFIKSDNEVSLLDVKPIEHQSDSSRTIQHPGQLEVEQNLGTDESFEWRADREVVAGQVLTINFLVEANERASGTLRYNADHLELQDVELSRNGEVERKNNRVSIEIKDEGISKGSATFQVKEDVIGTTDISMEELMIDHKSHENEVLEVNVVPALHLEIEGRSVGHDTEVFVTDDNGNGVEGATLHVETDVPRVQTKEVTSLYHELDEQQESHWFPVGPHTHYHAYEETTTSDGDFIEISGDDQAKTYLKKMDAEPVDWSEIPLTDKKGYAVTDILTALEGEVRVQAVAPDGRKSEVWEGEIVKALGDDQPENVTLDWYNEQPNSQTVHFEAHPKAETGFIEIVEQRDPEKFYSAALKRYEASTELVYEEHGEKRLFTSVVTELDPGVTYTYRVNVDGNWSEESSFMATNRFFETKGERMNAAKKPNSFLSYHLKER
ncbi:hypothetical protein DH09_10360 [Bacillaceae bacterium JMAK1]|nr:hypothetical protein DH09_10360 [Bacillaceae bacterium JMAK1]